MEQTFHTDILPSGMRIVCAPGHSDVVYCGVAIDAGTRDEGMHENGIAHYTEHLSFKGTRQRNAWRIINRMESVGGELNAFTGKEETVYYCTCMKEHFARAVDVLMDIVFRSTYPQKEMEKEVEVVANEIESYNDSPSELIYDEFENMVFQGHPLGRSILGDASRLRQFTTDDILRFTRRLYTPSRSVLFVYGPVSPTRIKAIASKYGPSNTCPLPDTPRTSLPPYCQQTVTRSLDTHQAHVMIGTRAFAAQHPLHMPLCLLSNMLGGPGLNSRLNQTLRERHGLVYTVESNLTSYTDTGVWAVYFGCDPSQADRCIALVQKELDKLLRAPLSTAALQAAKRQFKGQLGLSYDNFENVAIGMGKRFLHYCNTLSHQQLCERIDALTPAMLWQAARQVFRPDQLSVLKYV